MAERNKSKGFAILGVPVGSVLTFRKDSAITCTVMDENNKVEYQGKVYRISGLAKELMGTPISGYHAFKYNGTLLAKLGEACTNTTPKTAETAPAADMPPSAEKPVAGAASASCTAGASAPQTVALPKPQAGSIAPAKTGMEESSGEMDSLDPLAGMEEEI